MEPVVSLRGELAKPLENRPESAQLAAANPISEMATTCGQAADRSDAHMFTRSHATNTAGD